VDGEGADEAVAGLHGGAHEYRVRLYFPGQLYDLVERVTFAHDKLGVES
jgi:hypothetical protein